METWVRSKFNVIPQGWTNLDGTTEDAFAFSSGETLVVAPLRWFCETFGAVGAPPTASSLKAVDPEDRYGWHRHFDAWVEQGIIAQ